MTIALRSSVRRGAGRCPGTRRSATLRVVEDRLRSIRAKRVRSLSGALLLVLVSVFFAVTQSPWWWPSVAFWGGMLVLVVLAPAHLQRRAELFRNAGT